MRAVEPVVAAAIGRLAIGEQTVLERHQRRRAVDHRRIDRPPPPGRARFDDCGEHARDEEHRPAPEIGDQIERRHRRAARLADRVERSEEHTSELQSILSISSAVFCLKKKKLTDLMLYAAEMLAFTLHLHLSYSLAIQHPLSKFLPSLT